MPDRGFLTFGGAETLNPGIGGVQSRTLPNRFTARFGSNFSNRMPADSVGRNGGTAAVPSGGGDHPAGGNPMLVWVGLALALGVMIFAHKHSSHLQQKVGPITPYTIIFLGLTVVVSLTLLKMVFTRFMVPGLTQVVQAV